MPIGAHADWFWDQTPVRARSLETNPDCRLLLSEALAGMKPRRRAVLISRYIYGRTFIEIGAMLGITPQGARAHALKGLRDARRTIGE